jgi:hypothetical protein
VDDLWAEYLNAERSGIKKQSQVLLNHFIHAFSKVSAEVQENWFQKNLDLLAVGVHPLRHPLFVQVVYPRLMAGYQKRDLQSIKFLIKLIQHIYKCEEARTGEISLTDRQLVNLALSIDPNDAELKRMNYEIMRRYLQYTLHEIPVGVLYDMNGADAEKCGELLSYLEDFQSTCDKLQIDESKLIQICNWHFTHYPDYLARKKDFKGYKDYIEKNGGLTRA